METREPQHHTVEMLAFTMVMFGHDLDLQVPLPLNITNGHQL